MFRVRPPICVPESICVLYMYFNGEHIIRFRHTNRGSYAIVLHALIVKVICYRRRRVFVDFVSIRYQRKNRNRCRVVCMYIMCMINVDTIKP